MAVKIRLRRMGAKKAPFYRIVVADERYPRDGRFIEEIGSYDPTKNPAAVVVDADKVKQWLGNRVHRCAYSSESEPVSAAAGAGWQYLRCFCDVPVLRR